MKTRNRTLIGSIQLSMYLSAAILVTVLGYLWVSEELTKSRMREQDIRESYLKDQQIMLQSAVENAVDYVNYKRTLLKERVKNEVRKRTEEAYRTAMYIYTTHQGEKTKEDIEKLIHDALFAISWNDDKGYYFAESIAGIEKINRNNPELEGQDVNNITDGHGRNVMDEIRNVATSVEGEGFCTYYWNKPNEPGLLVPKVSYVKYFAPLDWVLGNGMYIHDEEEQIKREIVDRFENNTLRNDLYLFIGTWEGDTITGPAKGENMWDVEDVNGVKIVQELVARAKEGGGFVRYVMPRLQGERPAPKLSYSAPIKDWEWYLGTGVYIDTIENEVLRQQEEFRQSMNVIIRHSLVALTLLLLGSFCVTWWLSRRIQGNIQQFLKFFQRSASDKQMIQLNKVSFTEFQALADSANNMATDRLKAWQELTDERERLAVTLHSIGDGVITTDVNARVVLLNRVAEELTGWSQSEAVGRKVVDIFITLDEKTKKPTPLSLDRVLQSGKVDREDIHAILLNKASRKYNISNSAAPISDKNGHIIGVVLVFRDITNEKKIEEELIKVKKLESVAVLAGGIAHDFNNILSALMGYIELASLRIDTGHSAHNLLTEANKAGTRASKLTQQLLTFAKGGDPVMEEASLPDIIKESANFVTHGSSISLSYRFDDDLWHASVDTGQLSQVIQNIVINAMQALPDGGNIEISGHNLRQDEIAGLQMPQDSRFVEISIKDSGVGISSEILEKIFDPYFTTKEAGSGLGLAICHSIVVKHGGFLRVESEQGRGSTFFIDLPALPDNKITKKGKDSSLKAENGSDRSLHVLFMDDEEMIREVVRNQLIHLGHRATLTADGDEAVKVYRAQKESGDEIDMVILDLTIPGKMNGKDVANKLKEINPMAKIAVASGYSNDPIMGDYRQHGFCAAITKPFNIEVLQKTINSIMKDIGSTG